MSEVRYSYIKLKNESGTFRHGFKIKSGRPDWQVMIDWMNQHIGEPNHDWRTAGGGSILVREIDKAMTFRMRWC